MPSDLVYTIEALMDRVRQEVSGQPARLLPGAGRSYSAGTLLRFGTSGNAVDFIGSGWAHTEEAFRWTDGHRATLHFSFAQPPGDLVLTFTAHPLTAPDVPAQEVTARWNGLLVGEWLAEAPRSYHTLILAGVERDVTLTFDLPKAFSPVSKNMSADQRCLGLAFHELTLRPISELGF